MSKYSRANSQDRGLWGHRRGYNPQQSRIAATFSPYLLSLAAGLSCTFSVAAQAQTPPSEPSELQDIIVTAQKRSTNLQQTPISITALGGEDLQRSQVNKLDDIASLVPNFKMGEQGGYTQITIRGIGISNFVPLAESAVAVNVNEVYVSRPIAQATALFDVSAIEVLRGPQGTLYGRNATAGAVNVTTARPTNELSGYIRSTVGNYGQLRLEGAVGGAVADDKLLVRVAGFRERRNGYGKNLITGNDIDDKDAYGIRGTIVFNASSNLKGTIIGDYYRERDRGGAFHYLGPVGLSGLPGALGIPPIFVLLGGITPSNPYDVANGIDPKFRLRTSSVTGIVEWSSGSFSLKSITGYRDQNSLTMSETSGGQFFGGVFIGGEPTHQFSQELQAHYDTSRLHLTAGLFYFKEHADFNPATVYTSNLYLNLAFPDLPQRPVPGFTHLAEIGGLLKTTAKAAFAEGTVNVTDQLSLTAGIRYSTERKHLFQRNAVSFFEPYTGDNTPPTAVSIPPKSFDATTPKFGIQYQVSPDALLYATYAKGFKSGGFDSGTDPTLVGLGFSAEKLEDFEGGLKTMFFDRRVRLNLSGFYYKYTDLQVQQTRGFNQTLTANAGKARIYGMEAEFSVAASDALTINGNAAWLHARYTDYTGSDSALPLAPNIDFSGNRLNNAPDFRAFLAASYRWDLQGGNILVKGEGEYSTKFYFGPTNILIVGQSAYAKASAFITYTDNSGWYATGFVRNIIDKATRASGTTVSPLFGSPAIGSYAPPRTYGVELGYRF